MKIKNTGASIRKSVPSTRDKRDGEKICGSIDEHWRNPGKCIVIYRPDKDKKAISFMKSLSFLDICQIILLRDALRTLL